MEGPARRKEVIWFLASVLMAMLEASARKIMLISQHVLQTVA